MKKSYVLQFILTLLFGPLGMFYSSTAAALAFLLAAIVFGGFTFGAALLLIWPLCIVVSLFMVSNFNGKVDLDDRRHEELVRAVKEKK